MFSSNYRTVHRKHLELFFWKWIIFKIINILLWVVFTITFALWTRTIPYPPNFNKTPARIMDPATGASTFLFHYFYLFYLIISLVNLLFNSPSLFSLSGTASSERSIS
jgi:hypothetical protein